MATKLPVWGIDVGQCLLKAVKLQEAGDGVELLAFDVIEHGAVVSGGEGDATEMIREALKTFASRNNMQNSRLVVSVPGQQTLTRFTKMPPVEPKKIPDMVQYEASQQIPFDIDEVVWDYQIFAEKDSPDVEVGIFAIRKELIRNYLMNFTDLGLEPTIVQTSPMASYNAVRYEQGADVKTTTVILDMGALATDLIVMEGNRIWSRPIPIGGNRFTDALVAAFRISFKKAEKLKRTAAASKYARQVFQAMRPVFADLVSEVQRSIGFYTSTHRDANIRRVLGMGNAFKLPGLQKFLQQNLQTEVEKLAGFQRMTASGVDKSPEFAGNIISLSVAYGLALQGLGLAAVESTLLPQEVRRSLLWRKKRPWFAASAACLALSGASLWVGNVLAEGQLDDGIGNMSFVSVQRPPTTQRAEEIINGNAGSAPVERAATIAGAAEFFQTLLGEVAGRRVGDAATLKAMAKLPDNNVMLPRILDVIHRAFAAALPKELREAETPREYRQVAERLERSSRPDIWIERLDMIYHPQDPAAIFNLPARSGRGRDGWAVRVIGGITMPNSAKWLDDNLIASLQRLGREPDRGIHVDEVVLASVEPMGKKSTAAEFEAPPTVDTENRGGRGRGDRPGGDDRGRDPSGGGGGRGRGGQPPKGGGISMGGGGSVGQPPGTTVYDEIARMKDKFKTIDPLTGEDTSGDQRFELRLVIRKSDTPTKMIPEEFKPKTEEKTPSDAGQPQ